MRITSVREFRDRATELLRSPDPLIVTRRGRVAGIFFPWREATLPVDLRRELFAALTADISRQMKKKGADQQEALDDFAQWRKQRRADRRRR